MRCVSQLWIFAVAHSTLSQVLSGKRPFHGVGRHMISLRVFGGERPGRPSLVPIQDQVWVMLQACWSEEPTQRPTVGGVITVCMAHASQDVIVAWPPRSCSSGSRDTSSSQVTEVRTSRRVPLAVTYHPDCLIKEQFRLLRFMALQPCQRVRTEGD